ncbi:MAG: CoA pyrophosphatase, partial [Gammaproteobacteria bacterium]|nr:CoA pyrophosphatase [Gammaproteobacteria bacterium]
IEAGDQGPAAAALRETEEEIGIGGDHVDVLGYLDNYLTITGYTVTPVVGRIRRCPPLTLDANEVDDAFTVPLEFLFNPERHQLRRKRIMGLEVPIYEIWWQERRIWGATAAMLVGFYNTIFNK